MGETCHQKRYGMVLAKDDMYQMLVDGGHLGYTYLP